MSVQIVKCSKLSTCKSCNYVSPDIKCVTINAKEFGHKPKIFKLCDHCLTKLVNAALETLKKEVKDG